MSTDDEDTAGIAPPRRVGWSFLDEVYIPSNGAERETRLMEAAVELTGYPMPVPVYQS